MKIIHTADWHLGNRMHDIDRTEEAAFFLNWLKGEIEKEKAEALLVTGDIFDTINPPNEARAQFKNFLSSLVSTCCKNVVITGGNHDSAALLDSDREILSYLNIHIVGSIANTDIKDIIFELKDKDGKTGAVIGAVPFAREAELRRFYDKEAEDKKFSDCAWGVLYSKVYEEAEKVRGERNIPLLVTGHLYAADLEGRLSGTESEIQGDDGIKKLDIAGNLGLVHSSVFPAEFDYAALGHIHYTTMVAKNPKIRYSGSPFVMGFDEANVPRVVLSVDVEKGKTSAAKVQIPSCAEYRRIAGNVEKIQEELENYKTGISEKPVYLEICYTREEGMNIQDRLSELLTELEHKNVYVVNWKFVDENQMKHLMDSSYDMAEVKNIDPEKIFRELILTRAGMIEGCLENENREDYEKRVLSKYFDIFNDSFRAFNAGESVNENC